MSLPLGLALRTNLPPKNGVCGNVVLKQQRKVVVMQTLQPCDHAKHLFEGGQQRELALHAHVVDVNVCVVIMDLHSATEDRSQHNKTQSGAIMTDARELLSKAKLAVLLLVSEYFERKGRLHTLNSRSASFSDGLMGTTRCGCMPRPISTYRVLSQRSSTPLITYACVFCTCAHYLGL